MRVRTHGIIESMDDIKELFKETIAEFVEGSLESELDNEIGYEPYCNS